MKEQKGIVADHAIIIHGAVSCLKVISLLTFVYVIFYKVLAHL